MSRHRAPRENSHRTPRIPTWSLRAGESFLDGASLHGGSSGKMSPLSHVYLYSAVGACPVTLTLCPHPTTLPVPAPRPGPCLLPVSLNLTPPGTSKHVSGAWPISLTTMSSRSVRIVTSVRISVLLRMSSTTSCGGAHLLLHPPSVDTVAATCGHHGSCCEYSVQASFPDPAFESCGRTPSLTVFHDCISL